MAYPQYNHQWTPMHQFQPPAGYGYNGPNSYNTAPPHWTYGSQPTTYKPTATSQTLEIDDSDISSNAKQPAVPAYRAQTFRQKYLGGLKRTLRLFTLLAVVILIINVSWLGVAYKNYGVTLADDGFRYGTISSGNCSAMKNQNTWLHLAINTMSTLLLTGSNAFMAAYSGPTRLEVDQAHAKRRWLHIGSMSLRNMVGIAKRKSLVVLLLAISSAPFHLLYNSVVFTSLSTNSYNYLVVDESFLTGAAYSNSPTWDNIQKAAPQWEKLNQKACITAYANPFVSDRRNIVLVSSDKNSTDSILNIGTASPENTDMEMNSWICDDDGGAKFCNPEKRAANTTIWQVSGHPIKYCLSERVEGTCEVKFSMDIMYALVGFNALKVIAMAWIVFRVDAEHILTSVGDAVISFLLRPDPTTLGMCLANKRNITKQWYSPNIPRLYRASESRRWAQAVSRKRWIVFLIMMIICFCAMFFFSFWGFSSLSDNGVDMSASSLWSLGIGTANPHTMVIYGGSSNPILMALLANIPQIILAIVYLVYQGIITAMFLCADWAAFAFKGQTLMVSTPAGRQRGTWLLGAPLGWGIALVVLQTLLHWCISQSIFLVQLVIYDTDGTIDSDLPIYNNCGYSPVAIILSAIGSLILFFSAVALRYRRLRTGSPPIPSTCSAAISAACHLPPGLHRSVSEDVYGEWRWGVTDCAPNNVGHCSFAPRRFWDEGRGGPALDGCIYAGLPVTEEEDESLRDGTIGNEALSPESSGEQKEKQE